MMIFQRKLRSTLLITGLSLLIASCGGGGSAPAPTPAPTPVTFVYALQDAIPNQIHGFQADVATGALSALAGFPVATGGNGSGGGSSERMTFDAANNRLYVVNDNSNTVSAYSITTTTGALAPLPFSPIAIGAGQDVCIAVHPSGSPLVVGDNTGQTLKSFNITATTATPATGSPFALGGAVPFSCAFSQDGKTVYSGGGVAAVFAGLSVNASAGVLTALAPPTFNSGAANPGAYATDSAGRIFLADLGTGRARAFTTSAGVPTAVTGNPFTSGLPSAVHGVLHKAGFYLVATGGSNQVNVFQITGSGAATTLSGVTGSPFASGGSFTVVLALNSAGTHLYAANGNSRNITTFAVNASTGALTTPVTQPVDTLGNIGIVSGMVITR